MTLWLGWIVLASLFFTVLPAGPYGLPGWIAAVGPLVHRVVPRIGIRRVAVSGLLGIGALLLFSVPGSWLEILLPPTVFLLGLLLAPVPIATTPEHREDRSNTEEAFQLALAREVGRARRYERPLTLISIGCDDDSRLRALNAAIAAKVHVYTQLFDFSDRLLIIAPELDSERLPSFRQRLLDAIRSQGLTSVKLGSATFPDQELTASGLIDRAESTRRHVDLTSGGHPRSNGSPASEDFGLPQP